jgi:hypothetical protein
MPALDVYGPVVAFDSAEQLAASETAYEFGDATTMRTRSLTVEDVLLIQGNQGMQRAADLQGMWSRSTIPFESIAATTKLLTPYVGKVRATLTGGEMFEGTLFAVGEGNVWIDTTSGRMGLQGSRVKSVVQIDTPKGAPALGGPGSQYFAGLERVRVRTPGGSLYGCVVERNGSKATVMTDDGARIVVESSNLEPAGAASTGQPKRR